jgi:AcrR family transcriptional regulator
MVYRRSPRSEAVRAEARERILKAAFKLLTERGYDATTMQDVVAEAGTSIGNAYFYFGSKEALLRELIEGKVKWMMAETESAAEAIPAGPARIGQMIAARVGAFTNGQRNLAQLLLRTDQRLGTLEMVEDLTVARWLPQLAASFPNRPAEELPAAAAAIWAVNRVIIQRVLQGKLEFDGAAAVKFAVTWSLRALEVSEQEIESIVRAALRQQRMAQKPAGKARKKRTKTQ